MQATRRARLQSVILEELSVVVPRSVKDPRVGSVTFTRCEVTEDGSQATVYVSLLGGGVTADQEGEAGEARNRVQTKECLAGLTSAAGFLRKHLAGVLDLRIVPALLFREDKGLENTLKVHELLRKIAAETKPAEDQKADESEKK